MGLQHFTWAIVPLVPLLIFVNNSPANSSNYYLKSGFEARFVY